MANSQNLKTHSMHESLLVGNGRTGHLAPLSVSIAVCVTLYEIGRGPPRWVDDMVDDCVFSSPVVRRSKVETVLWRLWEECQVGRAAATPKRHPHKSNTSSTASPP